MDDSEVDVLIRGNRADSLNIGWCKVGESINCQGQIGIGNSWTSPVAASPGSGYCTVKRALDLVISALALIALSPLFAVIAILIKLDSDGPVFFIQERVGYDPHTGKVRHFGCFKFRSMKNRVDTASHKAHMARLIQGEQIAVAKGGSVKMKHDPRITRVGAILRRTSLDELPQLINVVKGEMSIVGPRPALPYEVEMYQEWHNRRLMAVPGLTGWWQVYGRNQVAFDEAVSMDIYYVENRSLWLDIKIMFLTPWAVISGRGAG